MSPAEGGWRKWIVRTQGKSTRVGRWSHFKKPQKSWHLAGPVEKIPDQPKGLRWQKKDEGWVGLAVRRDRGGEALLAPGPENPRRPFPILLGRQIFQLPPWGHRGLPLLHSFCHVKSPLTGHSTILPWGMGHQGGLESGDGGWHREGIQICPPPPASRRRD